MKLLRAFIDLLLYGNYWIAAAATAMCLQTQFVLTGQLHWNVFIAFVFFATLFLYAIHRIVGLKKVKPFQDQGRYQVIARFRSHILFYAFSGLLISAVCFFILGMKVQIALIMPCLLSLAYVVPIFGKRQRLRDFHFIKIFLIAAVWSWITVIIPGMERKLFWNAPLWIMALERLFFIFAITLPFDIRDLKIDQFTKVKTLPQVLGINKTKILAGLLLLIATLFSLLNYRLEAYNAGMLTAILLSYLLALLSNIFADRIEHDYFFTGFVDGLMIVQFLLLISLA